MPPRGAETAERATGAPRAASGVPAKPGEAPRRPEECGKGEGAAGCSAEAAGEFEARLPAEPASYGHTTGWTADTGDDH